MARILPKGQIENGIMFFPQPEIKSNEESKKFDVKMYERFSLPLFSRLFLESKALDAERNPYEIQMEKISMLLCVAEIN